MNIVTLIDSEGAGVLVDASGKNSFSLNNFHQAVKVGDRYFDALTQEAGMLGGATWDEYIKLWNEIHKPIVKPK